MRSGKPKGDLDALCSALDGLRTEAELAAFTVERGLQHVHLMDGACRIWKGRSTGAGVEIAIIPSTRVPECCELSVLVTFRARVVHIRRRPWGR